MVNADDTLEKKSIDRRKREVSISYDEDENEGCNEEVNLKESGTVCKSKKFKEKPRLSSHRALDDKSHSAHSSVDSYEEMGHSKRNKRKNEHDLLESNSYRTRKYHTSRYRNDSIESRGTWHKHHSRRSRGRDSSVSHSKKFSKTDLNKELSDSTEDNYLKSRPYNKHSHHYKGFSDDEDEDGKRNKSPQRHSSWRENRRRRSSSETYRRSVSKVRHKNNATKQYSSRSYRDRSHSTQTNHKRNKSNESVFRSRSRSYSRKTFSKETEKTKDSKKKERSKSKEAVKPVVKPVKKSKWDVSVAEMSDIDGKIGLVSRMIDLMLFFFWDQLFNKHKFKIIFIFYIQWL
jgi:hypothetical protein